MVAFSRGDDSSACPRRWLSGSAPIHFLPRPASHSIHRTGPHPPCQERGVECLQILWARAGGLLLGSLPSLGCKPAKETLSGEAVSSL